MKRIFKAIADNPKTILAATLIVAAIGLRTWQNLAVDIFPDISVPRVTIHTEAGGLTAEEVEQLVTIPIESVVNGIPGVSTIRSSSSGGLSFVWIDFDWNVDVARARFDVFERLARVKEALPDEAHAEISPIVSVTGEIMLVALTGKEGGASALEIREIAEYDLRTRLLGIPGIGEVAVIGGRLPEYRVAADPRRIAEAGLSLFDIMEAARDTRTFLSGGYLANVAGEEVPLRQIARADTLEALRLSPIPLANGGSLRLGDVADVSVAGEPRRGSASFNGKEAVVLSVQKASGGNTPALTKALEKSLADFAETVKSKGIEVHSNAYRQADFIEASIKGGGEVVRDAVIIVIAVLLLTLLELRTILVVLFTMPLSTLLGLALFPMFGLGVNVMTLGGFAVAAGDIVDAAIIFTEVIRRKLGENEALPPEERRPVGPVIADAAASVAPGVLFSTVIVVMVFIPLLMLSGLEGRFFRPLALSYICVFTMSLLCAWVAVPALSRILRVGSRWGGKTAANSNDAGVSLGVRIMRAIYRPFLSLALRFPKCVILLSLIATG
ncbi:MAG: efflux RND transporter permease subunit, partial [Kiritimatiellae bacterium]|nr:efflux RND transporter permease subunit [Kiritimatiellia bacterium]